MESHHIKLTYLDPKPEHWEDNATNYAKVAEPESKRGSIDDWKSYMKSCPYSSIQNHYDLMVNEGWMSKYD